MVVVDASYLNARKDLPDFNMMSGFVDTEQIGAENKIRLLSNYVWTSSNKCQWGF